MNGSGSLIKECQSSSYPPQNQVKLTDEFLKRLDKKCFLDWLRPPGLNQRATEFKVEDLFPARNIWENEKQQQPKIQLLGKADNLTNEHMKKIDEKHFLNWLRSSGKNNHQPMYSKTDVFPDQKNEVQQVLNMRPRALSEPRNFAFARKENNEAGLIPASSNCFQEPSRRPYSRMGFRVVDELKTEEPISSYQSPEREAAEEATSIIELLSYSREPTARMENPVSHIREWLSLQNLNLEKTEEKRKISMEVTIKYMRKTPSFDGFEIERTVEIEKNEVAMDQNGNLESANQIKLPLQELQKLPIENEEPGSGIGPWCHHSLDTERLDGTMDYLMLSSSAPVSPECSSTSANASVRPSSEGRRSHSDNELTTTRNGDNDIRKIFEIDPKELARANEKMVLEVVEEKKRKIEKKKRKTEAVLNALEKSGFIDPSESSEISSGNGKNEKDEEKRRKKEEKKRKKQEKKERKKAEKQACKRSQSPDLLQQLEGMGLA